MMVRLRQLLTVDDAARRKSAQISLAAGFFFGMAVQALGEPFRGSAYAAVAVTWVAFTARAWLYCAATAPRQARPPVLSFRRLAAAAAVAAALFALCVVPAPRLEAAAINYRLTRLALDQAGGSVGVASTIADTLDLARKWKVTVPLPTLVRIRDSIIEAAGRGPGVGALPQAANALQEYSKSKSTTAPPDPNLAEAYAAISAGGELFSKRGPASDPGTLGEIVALDSRAITLTQGEPGLQGPAFLMRANVYMMLRKFDAAASDARSAEAVGAVDLYDIFLIQGSSLARRGAAADDLRRAAQFLSLAGQMQPGGVYAQADGMIPTLLADVYYRLGEFERSREAALQALALAPKYMAGDIYQLLTLCELRLGAYDEALRTAHQYAGSAPDARSAAWLSTIERYPQAPQSVLDELEAMRELLSLEAA